jgi:integral membrane protein
MNTNDLLKYFRTVALIEGFSWFLLIIAMVLKYGFAILPPIKFTGWFHGLFFVIYCALLFLLFVKRRFNFKDSFILLIASFVPFGTFWAERKFLRGEY